MDSPAPSFALSFEKARRQINAVRDARELYSHPSCVFAAFHAIVEESDLPDDMKISLVHCMVPPPRPGAVPASSIPRPAEGVEPAAWDRLMDERAGEGETFRRDVARQNPPPCNIARDLYTQCWKHVRPGDESSALADLAIRLGVLWEPQPAPARA
ncbi:MAG: hypothetical protein HY520_03215 [Candidatus Aenigmarchaeota archaeon]|nr:hypothetical protein [Candidatus Aenigmarchaeota archaeon]